MSVLKGFLHSAFQLFTEAWVLLHKGFKALRVVRFVVQGFKPRLLHTGIAEILVCAFYRVPVRFPCRALLWGFLRGFCFGFTLYLCGLLSLLWGFLLGLCGGFGFLPCGGFLCLSFARKYIKLVKHFLVLYFLFGGLLFRGFLLRLCGGFLPCLSFRLHIFYQRQSALNGACKVFIRAAFVIHSGNGFINLSRGLGVPKQLFFGNAHCFTAEVLAHSLRHYLCGFGIYGFASKVSAVFDKVCKHPGHCSVFCEYLRVRPSHLTVILKHLHAGRHPAGKRSGKCVLQNAHPAIKRCSFFSFFFAKSLPHIFFFG